MAAVQAVSACLLEVDVAVLTTGLIPATSESHEVWRLPVGGLYRVAAEASAGTQVVVTFYAHGSHLRARYASAVGQATPLRTPDHCELEGPWRTFAMDAAHATALRRAAQAAATACGAPGPERFPAPDWLEECPAGQLRSAGECVPAP